MNERFRSPEEKSFHVFHSAASWSPLTRYIPLVAGDNSGQGSRLHQSLAIRVSGKIQSLPVTEPRMALVSATPSISMATKLTRIPGVYRDVLRFRDGFILCVKASGKIFALEWLGYDSYSNVSISYSFRVLDQENVSVSRLLKSKQTHESTKIWIKLHLI